MSPCPLNLNTRLSDDRSQVLLNDGPDQWLMNLESCGSSVRIRSCEGPVPSADQAPVLIDHLFHHLQPASLVLTPLMAEFLGADQPACLHLEDHGQLRRDAFYQTREHWLAPELLPVMPDVTTETGSITHPLRPKVGDEILYRRLVPALGKTVTLRQASASVDGEAFHRWQNDPRIARFWEYPFGRQELDTMLEERRADPHSLPLILEADGERVGYFECYYVREDRLGPYCDHFPWDQGMHMLVGERQFLGRSLTPVWLNTLSHFLFLREPRTTALWGEPRADNEALLAYLRTTTWEHRGEFDFPHKRAARLCNPRQSFFENTRL
ncbi:N2-citryl-N6-acetyl-N6-hydroxylysine synthase [Marinobacter daqiaonensis]|uniref:N2-citryl-N6-acetyl-N6-hydroxylysine synthase n=1 Tax=Marinobacter daqiaonensis TaxID=650891 RepID=A0A1I6HZZ0_9GAMM|nr:GNAT family N-acetyltransferase [Marinobacter daqiaonensis]SFR60032.1 N2-citryl-N6-acetyl-N6-hydroxylysine synthase [Marinobacter daqiaonensis]